MKVCVTASMAFCLASFTSAALYCTIGSVPKCRAIIAASEYTAIEGLSHPLPEEGSQAHHNLPHAQVVSVGAPMHPVRAANLDHLDGRWMRYSEHTQLDNR